jgi:hypothetical protein
MKLSRFFLRALAQATRATQGWKWRGQLHKMR